jgi:hypothetical protein
VVVRRRFSIFFLLIVVFLAGYAVPQNRGGMHSEGGRGNVTVRTMRKKNLETMNKQRFLQVKQDSEKLLELATEIHGEMDDANENVLSVKVVRDAQEAERLSKEIHEKMSEYIGPGVE